MSGNKDNIIKFCHWCKCGLKKEGMYKASNARGYGYYIDCPKCGKTNVVEEVDLMTY